VIAGSLLPRETAQTERNHNGNMLFNAWQLIIRLVAPFLLALLFLYNL
jgi:SNF family Na+-dependent transporter